jgi:hypothetical protein
MRGDHLFLFSACPSQFEDTPVCERERQRERETERERESERETETERERERDRERERENVIGEWGRVIRVVFPHMYSIAAYIYIDEYAYIYIYAYIRIYTYVCTRMVY